MPSSTSATTPTETWRAADGFGIGYQLFDADTGTLIVDGPRVHPERDVKPGETAHVRLDFEAARRGRRYQTDRLADARARLLVLRAGLAVPAGGSVDRDGVRDRARARGDERDAAARARCGAASAARFVYPVLTIWRNRGLIRVMVRRDILGRYRGSFGGVVLDGLQSAAADADVLLRVRRGAADAVSAATRAAPGSRLYLPGGHAAVAGLQRGGGTRRRR